MDPDHPNHIEDLMTEREQEAVGVVTLSLLKQCLSEGYPVVFGFQVFWANVEQDWIPWVEDTEGYFTLELPDKATRTRKSGHAVLAIGYDDNRKLNGSTESGMVLCQNSWGTKEAGGNWDSKDGLFWLPYAWILDWDATDDFWMLREPELPRPRGPQFPQAVLPQFHKQSSDWDGKLSLLGPSFADGYDYLTPFISKAALPDYSDGVSCVFANNSRYLLINDAPTETGLIPSFDKFAADIAKASRSVSRVIRPFSEQVNFGVENSYTKDKHAGMYGYFRLAVWEVPTSAAIFMGKGDKASHWSMKNRLSMVSHSQEVQEAKQWVEDYVTPNPRARNYYRCTFPGSRVITHLYLFMGSAFGLVDAGLTGEPKMEGMAYNGAFANGWQSLKSLAFVKGQFRLMSASLAGSRVMGVEPNAVVSIWEA